jgi:hypothetical protein
MVDLALLQSVSYMAGALGVCVAAIYYILNLRISQRNQELTLKALEQSAKAQQQTLETRQAQMFLNIYDQTRSSEFLSAFNKIVIDATFKNWRDFRELWQNDEQFRYNDNVLEIFYEGLGVLVKEGFLEVKMVALLFCGMTRMYWEKFHPILDEGRASMGHFRWFSETEYLYNELMGYLKEHPELDSRIANPTYRPPQ